VPPFVTELGEPTIDDCTWTSGLMLVATWTLGEVVTRKDGRPLGKKELSQLHNQLRSASGDQGFSNLGDFAAGVAKVWPQLRPLAGFIHGGDFGKIIAFDKVWDKLQNGRCAVLQGNPSNVANVHSGLKTTSADHAIFVHRAEGDIGFVQDPMRPHAGGRSQMREVPKEELRQYSEALSSGPFCLLVIRGDESQAKRVHRKLKKATDEEP
jgi:hypothetical protein